MHYQDQDNNLAQTSSTKISGVEIKSALALGVVAAFVGSAFSVPTATAAAPGGISQMPVISSDPSPAAQLAREAEDELLANAVGIDLSSSLVPVVDQDGKISKAKRKDVNAVSPGWTLPVRKFGISAVYGQAGGWASGHHTGLDFTDPEGTTVVAARDGKVISSEYEGAYGNLVRIRHADGLETWYAHLGSSKVKKGDVVKAGQKIGVVGMTGNTSGPHLHFEVRKKDKHRNPADYLWVSKRLPKNVKRG